MNLTYDFFTGQHGLTFEDRHYHEETETIERHSSVELHSMGEWNSLLFSFDILEMGGVLTDMAKVEL